MSFGDTTSTGMTSRSSAEDFSRSVSAFFDTREHAETARRDLIAAGIPESAISITAGGSGETSGSTSAAPAYHEEGFWESLKELFMPEEDRYSYAEGLRRGGFLVSVRTDTADHERVVDILDRDGAVDLDERESSWRTEGWTGYTGRDSLAESDASYTPPSDATAGFGASEADRMNLGTGIPAASFSGAVGTSGTAATGSTSGIAGMSSGSSTPDRAYAASAPGLGTASGTTGTARGTAIGGEETIPVVQEEVRIGKRDVSLGRVRIRSYVVETPVREDVTLRSERVELERRPVDRPVTDADRVFQDRTIEAEQRSEEAVVQKDVRVKEEIALRKDVEQRTETVSETARRTEVEVEDERGNAVAPTTTSTTPTDRKI